MKKIVYLLVVIFLIIFISPAIAGQKKPLATYTGPNKIKIISYHPKWKNQKKLKKVWDELMRNTHFSEIKYLSKVKILEGKNNSIYYGGYITKNGKTSYSTNNEIHFYPDPGVGNEDIYLANVLAHEYGHHYTKYYSWVKNKNMLTSDWKKSSYAKIRGIINNKKVSHNAEHKWQPAEIAAEDYSQLLGSSNARKNINVNGLMWFTTNIYNLSPQENLEIPLAYQVKNLESYFYQLAGKKMSSKLNKAPTVPKIELYKVLQNEYSTRELVFKWSKSKDEKNRPIHYTLVEFNNISDDLGIPKLYVIDKNEARITFYSNVKGKVYYRLFASDNNGAIVSSNILKINYDDLNKKYPPKLPYWHN